MRGCRILHRSFTRSPAHRYFFLSMMCYWTVTVVERCDCEIRDFLNPVDLGSGRKEAVDAVEIAVNFCYPQVWKRLWTIPGISFFWDHRFALECTIWMVLSRPRVHAVATILDNPARYHELIHTRACLRGRSALFLARVEWLDHPML